MLYYRDKPLDPSRTINEYIEIYPELKELSLKYSEYSKFFNYRLKMVIMLVGEKTAQKYLDEAIGYKR